MRAGLEWNEFSHSYFQGMYESNDPIKFILEKEMVDAPGILFLQHRVVYGLRQNFRKHNRI